METVALWVIATFTHFNSNLCSWYGLAGPSYILRQMEVGVIVLPFVFIMRSFTINLRENQRTFLFHYFYL